MEQYSQSQINRLNKKELRELLVQCVEEIKVFEKEKEKIDELINSISASKDEINKYKDEIFALHNKICPEQGTSYEKQYNALLYKAEETSRTINETKEIILKTSSELRQKRDEVNTVLEEIQSLLPKASASGLAEIYQGRIKEIGKPKGWWLFFIILSCVTLSIISALFFMI